jgi:hypothetical protein
MNTKKAAAIQPITAWFTSLTTKKQVVFNAGTTTALLIINKWGKVTPISLIPPNADQADAYKIQASDDLSLSSPARAYISKLGTTKFICGVMDKTLAIKFEILFIYKDHREGLPNNSDASKTDLPFTHLTNKFPPDKAAALTTDHKNEGLVPVLVILPATAPVGFSKPAPSSTSLANEETQTTLQTIADRFKAWANSVLHKVTPSTMESPSTKSMDSSQHSPQLCQQQSQIGQGTDF